MAKSSNPTNVNPSLEGISFEANTQADDESQRGVLSVLTFEIAGEAFAIGVDHTEGVVDCPRVSPLPSPPDGIIGVTSVRGRMTLVLELASAGSQKQTKRRLILLKGEAQLGLLADRVEGIIGLNAKKVRGPQRKRPPSVERSEQTVSRWPIISSFKSAGREVSLVDIDRLADL